ncbi:response regulator [Nakamurella sp.]|uniref:response regulator n=1 Tax=Nakamurella sp. TaxID=1869182 RepID=UPI003B3BD478
MSAIGSRPGRPLHTVVLCDDRAEMRRSVRAALTTLPALDVVAEAWDVASCGEAVHDLRPDLVVLDVNIPGGGPAAARLVKSIRWATLIVAYSGRHEEHIRAEMLGAGAGEYVLKTGRVGPLLAAVTRLTSPPALAYPP